MPFPQEGCPRILLLSKAAQDHVAGQVGRRNCRPTSREGSTGILLPEQFGRYKVERLLGKGSMGAVFLAEDTQLHRKVRPRRFLALAERSHDPDLGERFQREARAAAILQHPHICPIYDVGEINGIRYLTMAYIEGAPLSTVVSSVMPVSPRKAAAAVAKTRLGNSNCAATRHGIVHRDLKPANVMIDKRGEPILMDFGLARFTAAGADLRMTHSGMILGTPGYMSPEHLGGDSQLVNPPADIYSLGVIFYELLTGRLPFYAWPLARFRQARFCALRLRSPFSQRPSPTCPPVWKPSA